MLKNTLQVIGTVLIASAFSSLQAHAQEPDTTETSGPNRVMLITVEGVINPVTAEYITNAVNEARDEQFHALILQLDTPGGLLESTRLITKRFLTADVPVIVYVAPSGARAASAGVFISYAAHLVAMAPSTNIGAAHPVSIGPGGADTTQADMMDKITNDAVAQIKGMAKKRGRNAEWAEKAIRESVSITAGEALELNVINFVSQNLDSLLRQLDGAEVKLETHTDTLATKDAIVVEREMNWRDRILQAISDPNIAYIFLMLGIYGIFFELSNPGSIFPGVVGAIFLILFFYSMQTLPVNYAGLLLIALSLLLFILEIKITSYGLLTIGGIISIFLGSLMLFDSPNDIMNPMFQISMKLVITFTVFTALFIIFALSLAVKAFRSKVTTGQEGLLNEIGTASKSFSGEGIVRIHGEIWAAASDEEISEGDRVKVVAIEGLRLRVRKV